MPVLFTSEYISCEYCNSFKVKVPQSTREESLSSNKERVVKHEASCWFNPTNKTCMTCNNRKRITKNGEIKGYSCEVHSSKQEEFSYLAGRVIKVPFRCPEWEIKDSGKKLT